MIAMVVPECSKPSATSSLPVSRAQGSAKSCTMDIDPPNNRILSGDVINIRQHVSFSVAISANRMNQQQNLHHSRVFSSRPTARTGNSHPETNTPQVDRIPPTDKNMVLNELRRLQAQDVSITELLVMGKESERERQRVNEKRYRKKQRDHMKSLEGDTHQLRQEIKQLKQRQSELRPAIPLKTSIWSVAVAYFRVFRTGLSFDSFGASDALPSRDQLDFVQAALSPNVVSHGGCGAGVLLHRWRCFSISFQNIKVELEGLQKENSHAVVATTTTSFTLTGSTVRKIFPHLWNFDTEDGNVALLDKLVGQNIVMRGQTRFEWDGVGGYVTSVMAQSDFLTPVFRLVGGLEDVSRVFDKSLISPDFVWKV